MALGRAGGFFARAFGSKASRNAGQEAASQLDDRAPGAPQQPGQDPQMQAAPEPEGPLPADQTPLPTRAQTGGPARQVDADDINALIDESGAAGEMGPVEAEGLQGRMEPRRNINLDFFKDDSTKRTIEMFNKYADGFQDNPTRQVHTHAQTIERSTASSDQAVVMEKMKKVLNSDLNDKWEPEDLVSAYHMMENMGNELTEYAQHLKAQRTAGVEISTEDLAHYQLLSTRFVALQEIASVRAAEAGRMLNALQAVSKTSNRQYLQDIKNIVASAGGEATMWQNIDMVADARSLEDVSRKARQTWGQKLWNTAVQVRYNAMLSSFRTHAANIVGSAMTGAWEAAVVNPVRVATSQVDHGARAIINATFGDGTVRQADRARLAEIVDEPVAIVKNMRAAFAQAGKVFSGEAMGHGKLYNEAGIRRSDADMLGGGLLPKNLQVPTRMLEAEDAFFKTMYYNARIEVLARRKALSETPDGGDVEAEFRRLMEDPDEAMMAEADEFAHKMTFTNDPSAYGAAMGALAKTFATMQNSHPVGRLILPFVNTPANILGYTLENSGLGAVAGMQKTIRALADPEKAPDTQARLLIAAGMFAYLHEYWKEGKITGTGPDNYGQYRAREAAGWRENSIKVGDEYYELNRMDPMGLTLGLYSTTYSALAHSTEEDMATAAMGAIVKVADLLADRSMLSGLGDLERVFRSSESTAGKQAGKFGARMATSFIIPAIMRDGREMVDPYKRSLDTRSTIGGAFVDAIEKSVMNAVPGWSDNLPPQVDAFGNDKVSVGDWYYRGLVPIRRAEVKQDPVTAVLIATAVPVGKPEAVIKYPKLKGAPPLDLLALDGYKGWLYRDYQIKVGKMRHKLLSKLVNSDSFRRMVDEGKVGPDTIAADMVADMATKARRLATIEFVAELATRKEVRPRVGGEEMARVQLTHPFDRDRYMALVRALREDGPTEENIREVKAQGLQYRYTGEQQGLAPEFRLDSQPKPNPKPKPNRSGLPHF